MPESTVKKSDLVASLRALGVVPGQTLMAHSSLSAFGSFDGGAEGVIDALLEAVGPQGHVVMPSLTATFKGGGKDIMGFAFNPKVTPSRVGKITDLFWRRPNAARSAHPTHSIACIGPKAAEWMAGHDKTSTFGWDGPYAKYVKSDGAPCTIVFLGVFPNCNTTLHAIEDWLDLPYMGDETAIVEVNGQPKEVKVTKSPMGCRGFYRKEDRHHKLMEQRGIQKSVPCGPTVIRALPARACVAETIRQELETPGALLCLRTDCKFCTEGRSQIVTIVTEVRARANEIKARGLSD